MLSLTLNEYSAPPCVGRKRSRSTRGTVVYSEMKTPFVLAAVAFLAALVPSASAFSPTNLHTSTLLQHRTPVQLLYAKSASTTLEDPGVTRVQPRAAISESQRRKARQAMDDSSLYGVDAQMLELLSEHFLYPENIASSVEAARDRPKGRPKYVPGAMNYETLVKFRERQEVINMLGGKVDSTIAPYSSQTSSSTSKASTTKKNRGVKGATKKRKTMSADDESAAEPKRKRRVVKNLPRSKTPEEKEKAVAANVKLSRRKPKGGNVDLFKYYRTELLDANEEYSLGMQVLFMGKCEEVHEGLSTKLMRLPTIQEWAEACGFVDEDPSYTPAKGDEQIRPAGSESQFEEMDPNAFVGNGLAHNAGPGRGRGRVKKPPPTKLADFIDDSELRAASGGTPSAKKVRALEPINRGTVTEFIEKMMDAREAKQRMVQCNMRLVVSISRKYANVGVSLHDLVQEGSLGLSRAAEKFEPQKGFKFSTYASWWIQQAVFRSIAYHSRTIRLPVHVHNLLNRVRKVRSNLESDLGRVPTNEEVAESLDMPVEKYNKMLQLTKKSISLEMPKYQSNPKDLGHESEDLLGDTIDSSSSDVDDSSPETAVDRGLFQDDLKEMLQILNEDERRVICARYGLGDGLTRTVTLVAAEMRMPKAWVRSQECRALRKLRRPWYEKKLKEHQDALAC